MQFQMQFLFFLNGHISFLQDNSQSGAEAPSFYLAKLLGHVAWNIWSFGDVENKDMYACASSELSK